MPGIDPLIARRRLLAGAAAALAMPLTGLRAAAALPLTPAQTAGPFYPRTYPEDHDADLLRVDGRAARALGDETWVEGNVTDPAGRPLAGAVVEIWQCDANGRYHHPWDRRDVPRDDDFQGYGRVRVSADGSYRFRTIRPVSYPGRTPHIHFRVVRADGGSLVTQMYVRGEPGNARDGVLTLL